MEEAWSAGSVSGDEAPFPLCLLQPAAPAQSGRCLGGRMKHFSSAVFVRSHNHIIMNSLLTDFRWQKWPERLLRRAMTDRFRRCVTLSVFYLFFAQGRSTCTEAWKQRFRRAAIRRGEVHPSLVLMIHTTSAPLSQLRKSIVGAFTLRMTNLKTINLADTYRHGRRANDSFLSDCQRTARWGLCEICARISEW